MVSLFSNTGSGQVRLKTQVSGSASQVNSRSNFLNSNLETVKTHLGKLLNLKYFQAILDQINACIHDEKKKNYLKEQKSSTTINTLEGMMLF